MKQKLFTTEMVCEEVGIKRPQLQLLIRAVGMKPHKKAVVDDRKHNLFTETQVKVLQRYHKNTSKGGL